MTDATRTYRGRSSVAGYRGIAVGFPEKLSYSFNAETGTLSAIWRGEFVRVDRSGQGSGGFNPASKFIALAQDVSFFDLPDELAPPWPLPPRNDQESSGQIPTPCIPRIAAISSRAIYMDDRSIPTFMYRCSAIEIEDRTAAQITTKNGGLVRKLVFNSPKNQTIWFSARSPARSKPNRSSSSRLPNCARDHPSRAYGATQSDCDRQETARNSCSNSTFHKVAQQ